MEENLLAAKSIKHSDVYDTYKKLKQAKNNPGRILTKAEVINIVNSVHQTIAYLWSHSTGGVHFKRYGYFCMLRVPLKSNNFSFYFKNGIMDRQLTEGYIYTPIHINDFRKEDRLFGFSIDKEYVYTVRKSIKSEIIKGRRWTNHRFFISEYLKKRN